MTGLVILTVYGSIWSGKPFWIHYSNSRKEFKTLPDARSWAKANGYDGIKIELDSKGS